MSQNAFPITLMTGGLPIFSRLAELAIDYARFRSRSHDAVICVHDKAGNVIETHEHSSDFKAW